MARMSSVEFLRKVARHGLVQPMYDRGRIAEAANELEDVIAANRELKVALNTVLKFMTEHFAEADVSGPDAAELLEAIARATAPAGHTRAVTVASPFDPAVRVGELDEFIVATDPESGRLMSALPVVVERDGTGQLKALYHPALPEDGTLYDEDKFGTPRPAEGEPLRFSERAERDAKIVEADDAQPDAVRPEGDAERRD